jgi:hypothetical protein
VFELGIPMEMLPYIESLIAKGYFKHKEDYLVKCLNVGIDVLKNIYGK